MCNMSVMVRKNKKSPIKSKLGLGKDDGEELFYIEY